MLHRHTRLVILVKDNCSSVKICMSVCVVTKSHSLSRNLMNVVPRFEIQFEMHELRPVAKDIFSISRPHVGFTDVSIIHFRSDHSAELPMSTRDFVINQDDKVIDVEIS